MDACNQTPQATTLGLWQSLWHALSATRAQLDCVQALREQWHQTPDTHPERSYHWRQPPL